MLPVLPVAPVLPVLPVLPAAPCGPAGPGTGTETGAGTLTTVGLSHALSDRAASTATSDNIRFERFMVNPL